MPWLKLDDAFFDHEKILDRSKDAKLLHLAALTYCAARSPHGVLSPAAVRVCAAKVDISDREEVVTELLFANLWELVPSSSPLQPVPPGSYQIHDFTVYNPTPEQADALRTARREEDRRRADSERQRNKRERERQELPLDDYDARHAESEARHAQNVTESVTCHENDVTESVTQGVTDSVTCHGVSSRVRPLAAAFPSPSPFPIPYPQTPAPDIIPQTPTGSGMVMTMKGEGLSEKQPEAHYPELGSSAYPMGWEDAEQLRPGVLLARYREAEGKAGEERLAAWLSAARKPVQSQAAYLRPCILGRLRGDDPDPIAIPLPKPASSPTRSINAAAAAKAEAIRAEHGSVQAALNPIEKETS